MQRWLDAGVVVFGKTNTPELGAKGITEPALFGAARNPWDLNRTPGGSSGGSAAAVAAGIVPVAGASDGGGSIRIPAACCGLFGLKAGRGLIPFGPTAGEPLHGAATNGVISRSVRDSAAMLDVLAGPDATVPYAPAMPTGRFLDEVGQDPGRLRIGFHTNSAINANPHPSAIAAVTEAAKLLESLGHDVEPVAAPFDDAALARDFLNIWFVYAAYRGRRDPAAHGRRQRRLRARHADDGGARPGDQQRRPLRGAGAPPRARARPGGVPPELRPAADPDARHATAAHRPVRHAARAAAPRHACCCAPGPPACCHASAPSTR